MSLHEISRPLRKMSTTYAHARLQALIVMALTEWADAGSRGRVGVKWRFRVTPSVGLTRPLVPDVAYLSYAAVARDARSEAFEVPLAAPTVAFEILPPDERPVDVVDKIRTYHAAGSSVVIIVDPLTRTYETYDASGRRSYIAGDIFSHEALPGLALDIGDLFVRANR